MAFDTTFLIELQRERRRNVVRGPAKSLSGGVHRDRELCLSATALGEFAEGFSDPEDPLLRTIDRRNTICCS